MAGYDTEKKQRRMARNERIRNQNKKYDPLMDRIEAEMRAKDPTKKGGPLPDWT